MIRFSRCPFDNDTNIHCMAQLLKLDNKPYQNGCGDFRKFLYQKSSSLFPHQTFFSSLQYQHHYHLHPTRENKKWQCLWFNIRMRFDAEFFHLPATTFSVTAIFGGHQHHFERQFESNQTYWYGKHFRPVTHYSLLFWKQCVHCGSVDVHVHAGSNTIQEYIRDHDVASQFKSQIAPIFMHSTRRTRATHPQICSTRWSILQHQHLPYAPQQIPLNLWHWILTPTTQDKVCKISSNMPLAAIHFLSLSLSSTHSLTRPPFSLHLLLCCAVLNNTIIHRQLNQRRKKDVHWLHAQIHTFHIPWLELWRNS